MSDSATATQSSPAPEAAASAPAATPAAPVAAQAPASTETKAAAPATAKEAPKEPAKESFAEKLRTALEAKEDAPPAEYDLKAPEGAPEHVVGIVRDVAKLTGLPQDKAQAALEHVHASLAKQQQAFEADRAEQWAKGLYEHHKFDEAKVKQTYRDSEAFIARFVPEADRKLYAGALHPSMRIAMAAAHKAISPDQFVPGNPGTGEKPASDSPKAIFHRSLGGQ